MDWSIAWIDRLAENEDLVRRTGVPQEPPTRKKMIMTLKAGDKLMSLTDVSEMLGIPVHTLYRWRYRGDGPVDIGWAATCGTAEKPDQRS
jgi:hypothetical protein